MKKLAFVLLVLVLSVSAQANVVTGQASLDIEADPSWSALRPGANVIWSGWDKPLRGRLDGVEVPEGFATRQAAYYDDWDNWIEPAHDTLSQTFTVAQTVELGAVGFVYRGGGEATDCQFAVRVYDITALPGINGLSTSYTPGSLATLVATGVFNRPEGIPESKVLMLEIDALTLTPGIYAFEVQQIAGDFMDTGMYICRAGTNPGQVADGGAAYKLGGTSDGNGDFILGGQDPFETRGAIASWSPEYLRDFGMAFYEVPEPATIAMLGLGALALLRKRS